MLTMRPYAQLPAQRTRQVVGDLLVAAWVVLWVLVGRAVHDAVAALAAPGRTLEDAGSSLEAGLGGVGEGLERVPLVGDDLRAPFDAAGGAARSITAAGVEVQETVAQAALVSAISVAAWPIAVVLVLWGLRRWRFARRAAAAERLVASGADLDLFALRALARLPLPALAAVSDDPAGDWRRGDARVVRRLAELELRAVGLRAPATVRREAAGDPAA